ncbi:MAG: LysR family transcriptional regulator [Rhodobacter sp.]|nr:LysR family transcriptional regulator [Rhodobacter sp.]
MHKGNWDDLRFVLAVAENGSVSAAARSLGVNHATVLRRIAAFEARHGSPVFERTARGYVIPPDRLRLIEAAREVENAILAVDRMLEGAHPPLRGVVRITSTDTLCHTVLPPILADLAGEAAGLRLELICANAHLDLARMHADIAVRPAQTLPDDLDGIAVGHLGFAVYATRPDPGRWLGLSGPLTRSRPAEWLAGAVPSATLAGSADSFVTLREMAAAGLGRAILPCLLGDADVRLWRQGAPVPEAEVPIWVAAHADLADAPRIRVVRDRLAAALRDKEATLLGRQ